MFKSPFIILDLSEVGKKRGVSMDFQRFLFAVSRGDDSSICAAALKNAFVAGFIFSCCLASFGQVARRVVIITHCVELVL